jgi:hypothetical protein
VCVLQILLILVRVAKAGGSDKEVNDLELNLTDPSLALVSGLAHVIARFSGTLFVRYRIVRASIIG